MAKKYHIGRQELTVVDNVFFSINAGEFVAITGHSGSGKSTILQMMSGLEPPNAGNIIIDGQDITKLSSKALSAVRHKTIGIIFQNFYLEPDLTLRQNIELPAMFSNMPKNERKKRTAQLTDATELGGHLNHRPSELSGGQIQRTAILRAIYNKPKIIVADEPTNNLDRANTLNVLNILKELQASTGATIVIATHDDKILPHADRIIEIHEGTVR